MERRIESKREREKGREQRASRNIDALIRERTGCVVFRLIENVKWDANVPRLEPRMREPTLR